jgi:hypothetical protein
VNKLNQLLQQWPMGTVSTTNWLEKQNISRQLADDYENNLWIKRIGRGAFIRSGDQVDWSGGLYAIQTQLQLPVHVSGKSALELQGFGHFIPQKEETLLYLMGNPKCRLPNWFIKYDWKVRISYKAKRLFKEKEVLGLTSHSSKFFNITMSSPERAILELLNLIPQEQDFAEAGMLMESLQTLRPLLIQELLEQCHSIKAKRIALFLAEKYNLPWFGKLDLIKINLGKGKRVIVKSGRFENKYLISVPSDFVSR